MKSKEKTTIIVFLILIILYLICKYVFPIMGFYIAVLTVIVPALLSKLIGVLLFFLILWLIIKVLRK